MGKTYSAKITNIIALCRIIDDFEDFNNKVKKELEENGIRNFEYQLSEISKGKRRLGCFKAKKFYKENKNIIDIINKYSEIHSFITLNNTAYSNYYGNLDYFYKYISTNKKDISIILQILNKLKSLGFHSFEFNEDMDLTNETFKVRNEFSNISEYIYVDNIEVIPTYSDDIYYKTLDSNYKIVLSTGLEEISEYLKEIKLNSLIFDVNKLPIKLDKENTFDKILKLKKLENTKISLIKDSMKLNINILNLESNIRNINNIINSLEQTKDKDTMLLLLVNIKINLKKLKELSIEHEKNILSENSQLNYEILKKEKELYLLKKTL